MLPGTWLAKLDRGYRVALCGNGMGPENPIVLHGGAENATVESKELVIGNLQEFEQNYLTPKSLLKPRSGKHGLPSYFFSDENGLVETISRRFLYDIPYSVHLKSSYNNKILPHIELKEDFERIERSQTSFFSIPVRRRYKKMIGIYEELKDAEKNVVAWIATLEKVNDEQFLIDNVEYRLAGNLIDKTLWVLFMDYLKSNNREYLLQTYANYCRFFTDDAEMQKEYQICAQATGGVVEVVWKNPFDWEVYKKHSPVEAAKKPSRKRPFPSTMHQHQRDGSIQRRMCFPASMVHALLESAFPETLLRLQMCCKMLFVQQPAIVCYKFAVYQKSSTIGSISCLFQDQSIEVYNSQGAGVVPLQRVHIGMSFDCHSPNPHDLKTILPVIQRIEAKYVKICGQQLSMQQLNFIIGGRNVAHLELHGVTNQNGDPFKLEDIFRCLNRIETVLCYGTSISLDTAKHLKSLKLESKISLFIIDLKMPTLDPSNFAQFVLTACTLDCYIYIKCRFKNRSSYIENFRLVFREAYNMGKTCFVQHPRLEIS